MRPVHIEGISDRPSAREVADGLVPSVLNPELRAKIENEIATIQDEQAKKAKYKIQIWFKSQRSVHKPVVFTLSAWESGKRLHGGGDEMMFICRRHVDAPKAPLGVVGHQGVFKSNPGERGCGGLIPGGLVEGGKVMCPHCGSLHDTSHIGDSIFYRTSVQTAAEILFDWWRKLECNADIYAKYRDDDIRTITMARTYSSKIARESRGRTIYPLKNILKETANGTPVVDRFKAFITA